MSSILNVLAKWRQIYVFMLTMGTNNPAHRAIRDLAEAKLIHRAELSAISRLLIQKGIITPTELAAQVEVDAEELMKAMEKKFPGFSAGENGLTLTNPEAAKTMRDWDEPYGTGD